MAARTPQRRTERVRVVQKVSSDERVSMARGANSARERRPIRTLIVTLVIAALLLVVALIGFLVLAGTPAFTITAIDTEATEHLSAENIAKLANVEEGTTLLTFDENVITENLRRNPWVGEVSFSREFPDRLKIEVTERRVDCLVKMSAGSVCWCLGDDNTWIEPVNLTVADGQSADDVALALAQEMGAVLVTDVPTSMSPSAGSAAKDEVLAAISVYRSQFSSEFSAQVVCFSAASVESISCTLKSGVEVSLGAPTNIDVKEEVVSEILKAHPNQITYINVRVPSQPSYRKLGVETVSEGTGVTVDLDPDALDAATKGGDAAATGEGTEGTGESAAEGSADAGAEGSADAGAAGTTDATQGETQAVSPDAAGPGDMILGEDGELYTYEQYFGLD